MLRRYVAYGSNICAEQMARRCPAAVMGEVVTLPGWRFVINRRGVATLLPEPGAEAAGLIWHLTPACEAKLDRFEGVEAGHYRREEMEVAGAPALIYLATETRPGQPRQGYLERILAASALRGIPGASQVAMAAWGAPVSPWLVREVLEGYRLDPGGIHGTGHWLRVRANGLALAARTPGADAALVELFALLHDSRRLDEDRDTGHGERAADYVRTLERDGLIRLGAERLDLLAEACAGHEHGRVSTDPTIGCCWDADRLELSRLHRRPIDRLLSTTAARDPALQAEAWRRGVELSDEAEGMAAWGMSGQAEGGDGRPWMRRPAPTLSAQSTNSAPR